MIKIIEHKGPNRTRPNEKLRVPTVMLGNDVIDPMISDPRAWNKFNIMLGKPW